MGRKGDRQSLEGAQLCEQVVPRLAALGEVSSRKMFGGYGLFQDGKMFGLISSSAELFLKVDDSNRARFQDVDAPQHGKMPYFRVPESVLGADADLFEWARASVAVAHT